MFYSVVNIIHFSFNKKKFFRLLRVKTLDNNEITNFQYGSAKFYGMVFCNDHFKILPVHFLVIKL